MTQKQLVMTGLFIAVVSVVVDSGNAEARNRRRGGVWWQNTTGYANNRYYAPQNTNSVGNPATTTGTVNGAAPATGQYSVSRPAYVAPVAPVTATQPPSPPQNLQHPASQLPGTDPTSPLNRAGAVRVQQGGITDAASGM